MQVKMHTTCFGFSRSCDFLDVTVRCASKNDTRSFDFQFSTPLWGSTILGGVVKEVQPIFYFRNQCSCRGPYLDLGNCWSSVARAGPGKFPEPRSRRTASWPCSLSILTEFLLVLYQLCLVPYGVWSWTVPRTGFPAL